MGERAGTLLLLTSLAACGSVVVVEPGEDGGAPGELPSKPPSDDTSSTGPLTVGGGGAGGPSPACNTPDDCPVPEFECSDAVCNTGSCAQVYSPPGAICSAGICDGQGFCVECLDDGDCVGSETCEIESGICVAGVQTGVCADTFCVLLPADGDCVNCIIGSTQMECSTSFAACNTDPDGNGCATCIEYLQGSVDPFCAGSQAKFDAFFGCVCAPGVCLD